MSTSQSPPDSPPRPVARVTNGETTVELTQDDLNYAEQLTWFEEYSARARDVAMLGPRRHHTVR